MKPPANFNTSATKKDPLADAIAGNFNDSRKTEPEIASVSSAAVQKKNDTAKEAKDTKERFIITMAKGERSLFKSFCALKEVSMNHFVICAMDYFKEEVENGNVVLTPHGYKRQSN